MKKYKYNINLTKSYIRNAAYRYLERYATTEANLRFILERKVERIIKDREDCDEMREKARVWIGDTIVFCRENNLIDDLAYARSKLANFMNAGNSRIVIKNKLRTKGVPEDIISSVIEEAIGETQDFDLRACIKYARKRRFGPFRMKQKTEATEERELSSMARAGFPYKDVIKVLKSSREDLEDILYYE